MNIYVIYKFADHEIATQYVEDFKKVVSDECSFFKFPHDQKTRRWKRHAVRKLKDSHLVIFFDSLVGKETNIGKNIMWELHKAEKLKKQILVFKADPDAKERTWYEHDYSEKDRLCSRYETVALENAVSYMQENYGKRIADSLLRKRDAELTERDQDLLLDQYHIMIDTSEKLMERRQETVNLYTTLCTTLIAFVGTSFAFENHYVTAAILLISGLVLMVLCYNWGKSLIAYDRNNTGKFVVIDRLEKKLPAEIFQCEYRYNKMNGIQSFSSREKLLPTIFFVVGSVLLLAGMGVFSFKLAPHIDVLIEQFCAWVQSLQIKA